MDAASLAALVSKMQDHVEQMAVELKNVVKDKLSTEGTPADVDLNRALLQVENIAGELEMLVFQVEDALQTGDGRKEVSEATTLLEDGSGSQDVDCNDIVPVDWSGDELLCGDSADSMSIESDRSWRMQ
ncbi:uncharacterized protein LOC133905701 [Phragmites australis]|uniref:uncharacterized protein LOC133905701 n=1 Tax=Phragmites australis TaxID=29695 RepID=UPI002D77EADB|nr:uncharacterized protein LOC133905701 [Phragmites australis]